MRYGPRALLAGGLGFALSWLVACGGGSGLLSGDQANNLNSQLDQVSSALGSGDCGAAANASAGLTNAVLNLPGSINATLRSNLSQGASTVSQLAQQNCRQSTPSTATSTTPTSSTPTSTHTTTTPTASTATTTPPPTRSSPATTPSGSGTTSTGKSGGAGLNGGSNGPGSGGAGTSIGQGNGNGD